MIRQLVNTSTALLVVYNVLQIFKASKEDRRLCRRYNKYFMVMAVFLAVDNLFSFVLNLIPFYQVFKLMIVAWMSVPTCTGAVFVYKFYVGELMAKYEGRIDGYIEGVRARISEYFNRYYEKAQERYRDRKAKKTDSDGARMEDEAGVQSRTASAEDMQVDEGSDSGFSAIDSTINMESEKSGSKMDLTKDKIDGIGENWGAM